VKREERSGPWDLAKGFREECGVFGIWGHDDAPRMAYLGLYALQHRGQESAGIVTLDDGRLEAYRGMGYVADVFDAEALDRLQGRAAIGHVRYSTAGDSDQRNAQPLLIGSHRGQVALAHNGNFVNGPGLRQELESLGAIFLTSSDTEVVLHLMARSRQAGLEDAVLDALQELRGAHSFLFLTPDALYAARDARGFRPLSLGQLDGGWVLTSETCALDLLEARFVRDVRPGEFLRIDSDGPVTVHQAESEETRYCVFEHVYFSRPDSVVFGRTVSETRFDMGRRLAREHPVEADRVVPVPDSGLFAAMGYAEESEVPFTYGLIRNHYVGRTFIEPKQAVRSFGVRVKLNPVRSRIEGKRIILIDDSIVRGTTSRLIVHMLREAGAREIHMRISCPPTISPCYYGVDTPTREELIASSRGVEEICAYIGADTLGYLSLEGLRRAVGDPNGSEFCTACYTGDYPVPLEDRPQLKLFSGKASGGDRSEGGPGGADG